MVLVQKWPFFQLYFLGIIGQENVLYDILGPKNAFLSYKKKKLKNPSFWSNNGHFSNFLFLGNISQKNVLYEILEPKNTVLDYKYTKFKKSKNWHFSKGVNP